MWATTCITCHKKLRSFIHDGQFSLSLPFQLWDVPRHGEDGLRSPDRAYLAHHDAQLRGGHHAGVVVQLQSTRYHAFLGVSVRVLLSINLILNYQSFFSHTALASANASKIRPASRTPTAIRIFRRGRCTTPTSSVGCSSTRPTKR